MTQPDPDAKYRQALSALSSAMMLLMQVTGDPDDRSPVVVHVREALKDLTRARFLLVEVMEPDNILDELSKL